MHAKFFVRLERVFSVLYRDRIRWLLPHKFINIIHSQQQQPQVRVFNPQQFHGGVPQFQPGQVLLVHQSNGQSIPMSLMQGQLQQHRLIHPQQLQQQQQQGQQQLQQQQQNNQLSHMNQMDGNGDSDGEEEGSSAPGAIPKNAVSSLRVIRGRGASKKKAMKVLGSLLKEIQLDGNGGGMSDSSSEDEPDEEDDPLRRIVDRIGNGEVEDGDNVAEEDPLNSGDDQSDDEDLTMLFDAENVVMCQFEKINRARTKWKFQLKDGIMHIEKKDYCFQKCSGEAEW
uniref:Uncharacterized protein n=1 Tax=Caenorhabditis japonica TaxID=281687 RepID=A0A8R1I4M7_CAEJA